MKIDKHVFLLLILLLTAKIAFSLDNDSLEYKRIESLYYDLDSNFIVVENDSLVFEGYLVFKFNKIKQNLNLFEKDSNHLVIEAYWLNNLNNFTPDHKDYYWMSDYFLYYIYLTQDVGGHISDTTEQVLSHLRLYRSFEYQKFKDLFFRYYDFNDKQSNKDIFLKYGVFTNIFDDTSVVFLNYTDIDSIGYFIFRCSFSTSILKYKSFYVKEKSCDSEEIEYLGFIDVLLPISSAYYFKSIEENEYVQNKFYKANWYPDVLFGK